jgi:hypothetical protein
VSRRNLIVTQGVVFALILIACGIAVFKMTADGQAVSHAWSHTGPDGKTLWTGYRLTPPPHRAHPLAAVLIWLGAGVVGLLTLRFWAGTRTSRPTIM